MIGLVACVALLTPGQSSSAPAEAFGANTVGTFDTEEFKMLLSNHVHNVMEKSIGIKDKRTQDYIARASAKASEYIGKRLSKSDAHVLKNARLGAEGWQALSHLLFAMADKRVQK